MHVSKLAVEGWYSYRFAQPQPASRRGTYLSADADVAYLWVGEGGGAGWVKGVARGRESPKYQTLHCEMTLCTADTEFRVEIRWMAHADIGCKTPTPNSRRHNGFNGSYCCGMTGLGCTPLPMPKNRCAQDPLVTQHFC